jgi:hypothetical protein
VNPYGNYVLGLGDLTFLEARPTSAGHDGALLDQREEAQRLGQQDGRLGTSCGRWSHSGAALYFHFFEKFSTFFRIYQ